MRKEVEKMQNPEEYMGRGNYALTDEAGEACEGGPAGPNPYPYTGEVRYEKSNKTVVEVGMNALALLLTRTEKLCAMENAGPVEEEQIRRNVQTIAQGYAALKY
jgi:hypothetical protein